MRYPHYEGVGKRIRERLLALKYEIEDVPGKPDVARFLKDHRRYDYRSFYAWLHYGRTPAGERLKWLIEDLQCTKSWLLFGDESTVPAVATVIALLFICSSLLTGWVPAYGGTLGERVSLCAMLLIGSWRRLACWLYGYRLPLAATGAA